MKKNGLTLWKIAFAVYCLLMLWLLFGQRIGSGTYTAGENRLNLEPLSTVRWFLHVLREVEDPAIRRHAAVNLAGNVVMFVPLGFFLPVLWEKLRKIYLFLPVTLGILLAVELIQLAAALGCCDVDDLLLNLPGALLGYLAAVLFQKKTAGSPS